MVAVASVCVRERGRTRERGRKWVCVRERFSDKGEGQRGDTVGGRDQSQ